MIDKDEVVLLVCNNATAEKFLAEDPNYDYTLVRTELINDDAAIIVPKQEFIDWLLENGE